MHVDYFGASALIFWAIGAAVFATWLLMRGVKRNNRADTHTLVLHRDPPADRRRPTWYVEQREDGSFHPVHGERPKGSVA